jgi:hypothetical protein
MHPAPIVASPPRSTTLSLPKSALPLTNLNELTVASVLRTAASVHPDFTLDRSRFAC